MLTAEFARAKFEMGQPYDLYVGHGTEPQRENWSKVAQRVTLTPTQRELLAGFTRRMPVLVSSGIWCGDCAAQCPMLQAIAKASTVIDLRFVDRDEHADLAEMVKICGGKRVPTVVFFSEDFDFVGIAGDKVLSRLRATAMKALGASCALPHATIPQDEFAATIADWVDEFERAQLLLRLSTKLRQRHND